MVPSNSRAHPLQILEGPGPPRPPMIDASDYIIRKYSFCHRVVNVWNSLPDNVLDAENTNTFKARLDKVWRDQDMLYDYRAELTGIGSRSQV